MNLIHYEKTYFFDLFFRWFDRVLDEIATFLERPELKFELKYLSGGKPGRLQFC